MDKTLFDKVWDSHIIEKINEKIRQTLKSKRIEQALQKHLVLLPLHNFRLSKILQKVQNS